jgi:hypothetical protein
MYSTPADRQAWRERCGKKEIMLDKYGFLN